ncbi:hypothetical protein [Brevundimonas sp. GCM10030266]|uniref:hypothetical protein n=1 Tax=Brevundimonas sp. GCM10030266 TaxID=3273386 RepID=UPI0036155557
MSPTTTNNPGSVRVARNDAMTVVAIDATAPEGRAVMREAFGLSPLRRAEIRRSLVVSETDRAHPLFGGIFAGRRVLPDAEVAAMDAEIERLKAEQAEALTPQQKEAA